MCGPRVLAPVALGLALAAPLGAQEAPPRDLARQVEALGRKVESQSLALEQLQKRIDDVLWFDRVGDVAEVDKVYIPTVPAPKQEETYGIASAFVHTTTNDRDVNVVEVQSLIAALKAAGKEFEHKVYDDAPGGHSFNRMDSALARESRAEIYRFLGRHLKK